MYVQYIGGFHEFIDGLVWHKLLGIGAVLKRIGLGVGGLVAERICLT